MTTKHSTVARVAMRSTICHSCIPLAGLRQRGQLMVPLILQRAFDVPQPRLGQICRKVSFWRTIVLRPLAALRPTTASEMKAIPL